MSTFKVDTICNKNWFGFEYNIKYNNVALEIHAGDGSAVQI